MEQPHDLFAPIRKHHRCRQFNFSCNGIPAFFLPFSELLRPFHMGRAIRSKAAIQAGVFPIAEGCQVIVYPYIPGRNDSRIRRTKTYGFLF
jgi:hypothetical protein